MDFLHIPEAPSPEYTQDKHMHTQEELLNEIRSLHQEQMQLLQKMQSDYESQSSVDQRRFIITTVISVSALIAAVVASVAAIIPLI